VIRPEQLAAALDRLDARDRELLTLSLRRRVLDDSLARVYGIEPAEVARRRTNAIERLADELEIENGEELGAVLETLVGPGGETPGRRVPHLALTCYPTAYVRRAVTLYRRPAGAARVRLAARTEWKSPRVPGVVRRAGKWIGVQAPELRNGEIGWLPAAQAQLDCVRWSLHADISVRRLHVRWSGRTVRRYSVAVGSPAHPTPRGRFSVTDKLRVTGGSSPYGCCVLALTGHQLRLPPGWPGGDRLAVHATNDLSSIGKPVSLGCMRTDSRRARWLIETIPQGTPIFIRS
jgi:L,D-transpeptidase catalytic domain